MSISQEDLERAYYTLQDTFAELTGTTSWESVRMLQSANTKILRIARKIDGSSDDTDHIESNEPEITEDDAETVCRFLSNSQPPLVVYDIAHSPTYQVPVLYVTFQHGALARRLPSLEHAYGLLTPQTLRDPMQHVGVLGALSMTDHPATGTPALFVHPCQTAAAMGDVAGREEVTSETYLLRWMGLIGQSVGLNVPIELAQALNTPTRP